MFSVKVIREKCYGFTWYLLLPHLPWTETVGLFTPPVSEKGKTAPYVSVRRAAQGVSSCKAHLHTGTIFPATAPFLALYWLLKPHKVPIKAVLPGSLQSDRASRNTREKEMPRSQKYNGGTSATAARQKEKQNQHLHQKGWAGYWGPAAAREKEKEDMQGSKEGEVPVSVIVPLFLSLWCLKATTIGMQVLGIF